MNRTPVITIPLTEAVPGMIRVSPLGTRALILRVDNSVPGLTIIDYAHGLKSVHDHSTVSRTITVESEVSE